MKDYIFEDGTHIICKGMSKQEMYYAVLKHGKCIDIKKA